MFHWDYYNSFVIQPMIRAVVDVCAAKHDPHCALAAPAIKARGARYAAVLERMVSPEGTLPVMGRSLVCVRPPYMRCDGEVA
jgi:hypothetical protein